MIKSNQFKVVGIKHYMENIGQLCEDNEEYHSRKSELKENNGDGDVIYEFVPSSYDVDLIPEPENEKDPNAVRVEVSGLLIGYIAKEDCDKIKTLLSDPGFKKCKIEDFHIGKCWEVFEDDNEKISVEKNDDPMQTIIIKVLVDDGQPEPQRKAAKSSVSVDSVVKIVVAVIVIAVLIGVGVGAYSCYSCVFGG